jgi:hypothetical protein
MYADFRTNFDKGLRDTLEAVARVTSEGLGRYEEPGDMGGRILIIN